MPKVVVYPYYPENPYQANIERYIDIPGIVFDNIKFKNIPRILSYLFGLSKTDIIHLHWLNNITQTKSILLSLSLTIVFIIALIFNYLFVRNRIIYTMHNKISHYKKLRTLDKLITKIIISTSNNVVVHAEFQKNYVNSYYGKCLNEITVMYHGNYDLPEVLPHHKSQKNTINNDLPVLIYFGRIGDYKNISKAAKIVSQQRCKLILMGYCASSTLEKELLTLVKNNPDKVEWENKEFTELELVKKAQDSDFIILPQPDIFTSGSALLALSLYKPILAHKSEFYTEIFGDCVVQYSMIENLNELDGFIDLLRGVSIDKLKTLEENYQWHRTILPLRNIYNSIEYN